MKATYQVNGMTCDGCVRSLSAALAAALPAARIDVELQGGLVRVEGEHDEAAVQQAVADSGFEYVGKP
jgi:copper chaperone